MTEVILTFNGRTYRLACDLGDEPRLALLAAEVQQRLGVLIAEHGPVGDDRLLLMAAIQLADDLVDRTAERDDAIARLPPPKVRKGA
jgi:cell division protein ZapA